VRLAALPDPAQPSRMKRKLPDCMVTPAYGPDLTFGHIAINEVARLCDNFAATNNPVEPSGTAPPTKS